MAATPRQWALGAALCALVCSGLPTACEVPEYSFVEGSVDGNQPPAVRPRCGNDADCARFAATSQCDPLTGHCVECIPGRKGQQDSCPPGQYCEVNRCQIGCDRDSDCQAPLRCDLAEKRCVNCSGDDECGRGSACQDSVCVPSCTGDVACPSGFSCCQGVCGRTVSDPLHCGGCSVACADGEDCINGHCGPGDACPPGFADCDRKVANGCEVNVRTSQQHCGVCDNDCSPQYCSGGHCTDLSCPQGFADCDRLEANGCEINLDTVENCGACGKQCSGIHGAPTCAAEECGIVCDAGFDDCDLNSATGCETDVSADEAHCGDCATACSNAHGTSVCREGSCVPICAQGFDSCDGNPDNGCETDVRTSLQHCGACSETCQLPHASSSCTAGVCRIERCEEGFFDCDGDTSNGCEADLSSADTCGDCQTRCSDAGGKAACESGRCRIQCDEDRADCSGGVVNGCETHTSISVLHCGGCDNACPQPSRGKAACIRGECGVSPCREPLADCNNDYSDAESDGCETDTTSDPLHCGGCGSECAYPNAIGRCKDGGCELQRCEPGFADCNEDVEDGCETRLGTVSTCGGCGDTCISQHGVNACSKNSCSPTCDIGFGDCDGNPSNGCETALDTLTDCGACNVACARRNASVSCESGSCQITQCANGYGDCDDEALTANGCETRLNSLTDCGRCGAECGFPHASASCSSGQCVQGACEGGFGDCSASLPGCETQLGKPEHCQACGNSCQSLHASTNRCVGTSPNYDCEPECNAGYSSCDDNPDNGCETDINTVESCGACNRACQLPNAKSYACAAGQCQVRSCEPGFAHCNTDQTDGCERDVSTDIKNCGDCGRICSTNHGTPNCEDSKCSIACSAGYGDCNEDVADGCELDLSGDRFHCGACGAACPAATPFCVAQSCQQQLVIGVVNSATKATSASTGLDLTVTHKLANDAGVYRVVLVGVASKGNGNASRPRGVSYAGTPMTLLREADSGNQAFASIWALADKNLPKQAGTYPVLVQARDVQNSYGFVANVVELMHVEQANIGLDVATSARHGNCINDTPNANLTPTSTGDFVYSLVALYGGVTPTVNIARNGQKVSLQDVSGSGLGAVAGYLENVGATISVGWSPNNCSASAHAVVALRPAVTP